MVILEFSFLKLNFKIFFYQKNGGLAPSSGGPRSNDQPNNYIIAYYSKNKNTHLTFFNIWINLDQHEVIIRYVKIILYSLNGGAYETRTHDLFNAIEAL